MNEEENRIVTEKELKSILNILMTNKSDRGEYVFYAFSMWQGSTRWARNRIGMTVNRKEYGIIINRAIDKGFATVFTNQIDENALASAIKYVEWKADLEREDQLPHGYPMDGKKAVDLTANVWSNATASYNFMDSGTLIRKACGKAEERGVMSAGYVDCTIGSMAFVGNDNTTMTHDSGFARLTRAQCSMTARSPQGTGSGWAGKSDVDFDRIEGLDISDKALEKCLASMNPVRIEPGRYTVILEPQAVADMVADLLFSNLRVMQRHDNERYRSMPFYLEQDYASGLGLSKLGLKLFDERISVWHDPMDPELGVVGLFPKDRGIGAVTWVKDGVLRSLAYSSSYAVTGLDSSDHNNHRKSFRMSGGKSTLEEMIATTERGILVTRFSSPSVTHFGSMMSTGLTRDGLWLIEKGKISNSLRNFRTLESPFFILNNIEQIGNPVKVFTNSPATESFEGFNILWNGVRNFAPQYIVPPLKIKDFSFSTTIDAV